MHLTAHSYYSLRYGTLSPAQLVEQAAMRGIRALALTDINNTSCTSEFIRECRKSDIKPIAGIQFHQENEYRFTGIAANPEGFKNLNQLLTHCSLSGQPIDPIAPPLPDTYVIYRTPPKPISEFRDNEFVSVRPDQANQLYSSPLGKHPEKLIINSPITFLDEAGFRTHKLLRCIDHNIILGKLKPENYAHPCSHFNDEAAVRHAFRNYPQIIHNTERLLDECEIDMSDTSANNRRTFTGNRRDDYQLLIKLATRGCQDRYGLHNNKAYERLQKELRMIQKLGFAAYFLITWDIIRYAKSAGYHHVGRGSGANSLVAFCLFITDVDPLELDLYFERFINPHRSSPPDFDIDFSWDQRDDVTDYIFKRYGQDHTALLATYSTFKGKSIIRELGKVVGLPKKDIDLIVDYPMAADQHHPFAKHIFNYGKRIEKFPNYLSIHAGGILISERPMYYHTALQMMPKGFPITHFDMYHAEDLGFHKYDVLSQRGLGHIKDTVALVKENKGVSVDIHDVPRIKNDPRVRSQLYSGQCIGCFYIESPAMRGLLTKLHCDNYIHLVAASSIIRPGVAKSGMMREYIKRFHHRDEIKYLHSTFEEHLGETFGVMVYQEDVMKIVHHFAGLDLDESDVLRRIMTGKKKSSDTFRNLMEKFFRNCRQRGYSEELTQEVWRQVESFSGYSFCKAHSASFAVESFQSLYLKSYYPLEFMVGVINNFGGFYSTEVYVHEARMQGAKIEAPCVNKSRRLTHIYQDIIYIGFVHIHSLESKIANAIVLERERNGDYENLADFVHRVNIGKEQLQILIRIGAFRFTEQDKCALMWTRNAVHNPQKKVAGMAQLFKSTQEKFELPTLEDDEFEQAFDEIELLGFPLCSPFELIDPGSKVKDEATILTRQMRQHNHKVVWMLGYYITRKPVTTVNGRHMSFGTWLDREGRFFDSTHFPPAMAAFPFLGKGIYIIEGRITEDFDFPSLEVMRMKKLPFRKDNRY